MENQPCFCAQCAQRGRTCCQDRDIYVTPGDVRRIHAQTRRNDFYEFRKSSDSAYEDQGDDPRWAAHVFRPDGSRRVLKLDAAGNCIFLMSHGCSLSLNIRPLVCRLHPYNYTARGLDPEPAMDCPVDLLTLGQRLDEVIAGFGQAEAPLWHRMLYTEILGECRPNEDLIDF
ncbi:MAG: YkgJ family cysteine cluster protein [Desulfobacterales bacterium]|nr:MAG: YkgJ family cysteine cluster protein [Desulfobacterales bacterium]